MQWIDQKKCHLHQDKARRLNGYFASRTYAVTADTRPMKSLVNTKTEKNDKKIYLNEWFLSIAQSKIQNAAKKLSTLNW